MVLTDLFDAGHRFATTHTDDGLRIVVEHEGNDIFSWSAHRGTSPDMEDGDTDIDLENLTFDMDHYGIDVDADIWEAVTP